MAKALMGAPTKLPQQNPDNWKWQDDAACKEVDYDLFFYEDQERGDRKQERITAAKAICNACPVINECLSWANSVGESHGIWGGQTPEERGWRLSGYKGKD